MFIINHYRSAVHISATMLAVAVGVPVPAGAEALDSGEILAGPSATGALIESLMPIPSTPNGRIIAIIEPDSTGLGVILFDPDGSSMPSLSAPSTTRLGRR